jgi:hypothetical protein
VVLTDPLILLDTTIVLYFLGGRLADQLPSGQYTDKLLEQTKLPREKLDQILSGGDTFEVYV